MCEYCKFQKGGDIVIVDDQIICVHITNKNITYYKKQGYSNLKVDDILHLKVSDLSKGSRIKVDVKCDYCGKIVKVVYGDYNKYKYDKYSCSHCKQKKVSEYSLKQRQDDLYKRALDFCNEKGYKLLTPKSDILSSETRISYECPKHGIHKTKIYTLISRHGCIDCGIEYTSDAHRKKYDEVYNDFKKYGGVLINKDDYISWNCKNLNVICKECGETFTTSYGAYINRGGQVCPKCTYNTSKGERAIKEFLENKKIKFDMQYRFDDCKNVIPLPFDFYLYEYNTCIEYDGEGHYIPINRGNISNLEAQEELENIKFRDNIKTQYCKDNNIKLIRIPYWNFDNIETILNKELFT